MKVLFVENDDDHFKETENALRRFIPSIQIQRVRTERAFQNWLSTAEVQSGEASIRAIILDWRLPWDDSPATQLPPGGVRGGIDYAGYRCLRLLEASPLSELLVIVYTALTPEDLEPELQGLVRKPSILEKGSARELARMLGALSQATTTLSA